MGTNDTWPEDGTEVGGVITISRPAAPGTDPAAEPGSEPGIRRGGPARVPPQRSGRPRPGQRRPAHPGRPGRPGRPGHAVRGPAPDAAPDTALRRATASGAVARHTQRMPFFLLLCGLLGGALISALVISTTLAAGSYQITRLQQANDALARQRQVLQEQVAAAQSAQSIQQLALQLGMRPAGELRFLNLKTGRVQTNAGTGADANIHVPGYVP